MTWALSVNGTDLSSLTPPLLLNGIAPWDDSPISTRPPIGLPNRVRSRRPRTDAVNPRLLTVPLLINAFNTTDKETGLRWIKKFTRQSVTFRRDDGTTAYDIAGTVLNAPFSPVAVPGGTAMAGGIVLQCEDPVWRATSVTTVAGIGGTPVTLAMGTAPVEDWALDVTGFTSNLTITLTGATGYVVTYLTTLAGGHTLHLNADLSSCLDNASNTINHLAGGFPALDPAGGGTPVTIALTASAGAPSGTLTYFKKYY